MNSQNELPTFFSEETISNKNDIWSNFGENTPKKLLKTQNINV